MGEATIYSNFWKWCAYHDVSVQEVAIVETREDRLFFTDPSASLLVYGLAHGWDVSEPKNHGKSVILSLREPEQPSLQVCVHRALDASNGRRYVFYEIDFDHAPPLIEKPKFMAIHIGEVVINTLTRRKTNQQAIADGLSQRGIVA